MNKKIFFSIACAIIWKIVAADVFTLKTPMFEIRAETGKVK
jgi:hypothetical protein